MPASTPDQPLPGTDFVLTFIDAADKRNDLALRASTTTEATQWVSSLQMCQKKAFIECAATGELIDEVTSYAKDLRSRNLLSALEVKLLRAASVVELLVSEGALDKRWSGLSTTSVGSVDRPIRSVSRGSARLQAASTVIAQHQYSRASSLADSTNSVDTVASALSEPPVQRNHSFSTPVQTEDTYYRTSSMSHSERPRIKSTLGSGSSRKTPPTLAALYRNDSPGNQNKVMHNSSSASSIALLQRHDGALSRIKDPPAALRPLSVVSQRSHESDHASQESNQRAQTHTAV
jgi:hypothetical protein